MFENWELWGIFEPKREEVTGVRGQCHNKEFQYVYTSLLE
jgi:hypothetical protein